MNKTDFQHCGSKYFKKAAAMAVIAFAATYCAHYILSGAVERLSERAAQHPALGLVWTSVALRAVSRRLECSSSV